jgi:hypothetical protein
MDLGAVLAATPDHHDYPTTLASRLKLDEATVNTLACRAYAAATDPSAIAPLIAFLRAELADRR